MQDGDREVRCGRLLCVQDTKSSGQISKLCVSPYPEEGSIQSRRKGLHVGVSDALSKSTSDPFGQEHLATNTKGGGGGTQKKKKMITYYFTGPVHQTLQEYWQDGVDPLWQAKAREI